MRRKLIAGNWKMYKTDGRGRGPRRGDPQGRRRRRDADALVAPPFTALGAAVAAAKGSAVAVGAQNMHFEKEGAFTGEVSAPMLVDVGVTHVILGHSERRQYFGETDDGVAKKTKVALASGLAADLLRRRDARRARGRAARWRSWSGSSNAILGAVTADEAKRVVIAYEPVWAIGTGKVATPEQAQEVHAFIRCGSRRRTAQAVAERAADPLRRQRQARQREGPDGAAGRRRRPRRRRLAQGRLVPEARALRPLLAAFRAASQHPLSVARRNAAFWAVPSAPCLPTVSVLRHAWVVA